MCVPGRWSRTLVASLSLVIFTLAITVTTSYAQDMTRNGEVSRSENVQPRLEPASWRDDALTIANLGHASVLMNYFGVRAISDPSLFTRVGLSFDSVLTIGPKRHVEAPLAPAELQQLDVILITHAHMDHLDVPSLKALPKNVVVVACSKCSRIIAPLGFKDIRELNWGEETVVKGLRIRAMGARHWGRRWPPFGEDYGFNSYVLERDGHRVLLACDSAKTDLFADVASPPPDVAIFSIGAYDPWIYNHANPEEVWAMFQQTGARYLIPIHWGTFKLSNEPMEEPLQRLIAAAGAEQSRIVIRQIGGTWTMPSAAEARTTASGADAAASSSGR
ncbi:MAG TPA: MBL fold metallo-hydrolase [Candidatus Acidoferrales bacterium]|nr:MBL fold metallo-hydrolase [Candidatus Acidoferrales bacterium]